MQPSRGGRADLSEVTWHAILNSHLLYITSAYCITPLYESTYICLYIEIVAFALTVANQELSQDHVLFCNLRSSPSIIWGHQLEVYPLTAIA
jgi:hypothetical protein